MSGAQVFPDCAIYVTMWPLDVLSPHWLEYLHINVVIGDRCDLEKWVGLVGAGSVIGRDGYESSWRSLQRKHTVPVLGT